MKKTNLKKGPMTQRFQNYLKSHKKLLFFSGFAFLLLCLVTLGPIFAKALMEEDAARTLIIQQKNIAIEQAIIDNDYSAWSSLVTDESLKQQINSSNFSQFTQIYRLLQQGKVEEAAIIKKQLNLKQDFNILQTKSSLIDAAIGSNDYNAWRNIVGPGWEPSVNSTNFTQYSSAYKLLASGKLKQADLIRQSLNIKTSYDYTSSR